MRHPTLDGPVALLGVVPASATVHETIANTKAAGADGIEVNAWVSADFALVLHPSGKIGRRPLRRRISTQASDQIASEAPTLDSILGPGNPDRPTGRILVHLRTNGDFTALAASASASEPTVASTSIELLQRWRPRVGNPLVLDTALGAKRSHLERLTSDLAAADLNGLRLHHSEWNAGFVSMVHRFGLRALAWGPVHEREIVSLLDMGIDVIAGEPIDRLVQTAQTYTP